MMIVGSLFWGTYVFAANGAALAALEQNHGPAFLCGAGVVVSLLGKYIRF